MSRSRAGKVFSIDPGLSGTGWAYWLDGVLLEVGIVHDKAKDDVLAARCAGIAEQFIGYIGPMRSPDVDVFIEMPQAMANAKGIAAQAGAVYKLTFLVGYLARAVYPCEVTVVQPIEWKGQLPKDVVQRRVERILGVKTCRALNIRSHVWDAVGIGLWAHGRL